MAAETIQKIENISSYEERLRRANRITPAVRDALDRAFDVRETHDLVYYIAGALTGMSEEVKERYRLVSDFLGRADESALRTYGYAPHINGTDPVKHPDVTPGEVRDIDYLWAAKTPDCHINFLDPTAHGNAIEAGWAEEHDIPAIYVVKQGLTLSRLVRGMHNVAKTIEYEDFARDGMEQLTDYLEWSHLKIAEQQHQD